jgi:uncharacterized membrane protein YfcA
LELHTFLLLFAGGALAGVINVIVGGAGFMTFPLLVAAGMSEIEANASNFVAVMPANVVGTYAYRSELASVRKHLGLRLFLAALGGIVGSTILIYTGQASFQKAIPWLLFFATLSFSVGPWFKSWLERHFNFDGSRWLWLSFILEFLVYVYGGYFGLGMGILMFTIYALFSHMSIHQANAIRNITISLMTRISILIFARADHQGRPRRGHDVRRHSRQLFRREDCKAHRSPPRAPRHSHLGRHSHRLCLLEIPLSEGHFQYLST